MDKINKESMETEKENMTVNIFRRAAGIMAIAAFLILYLLILRFGAIPLVISGIFCTGLALTSVGVSESLAAKQDGKPYSISQSICLLLACIFTLVAFSGFFILFGGVPILWALEIIGITVIASTLIGATFVGIFDYLRQDNKVGPSSQNNLGKISETLVNAERSVVVQATLVDETVEAADGNVPLVEAVPVDTVARLVGGTQQGYGPSKGDD